MAIHRYACFQCGAVWEEEFDEWYIEIIEDAEDREISLYGTLPFEDTLCMNCRAKIEERFAPTKARAVLSSRF